MYLTEGNKVGVQTTYLLLLVWAAGKANAVDSSVVARWERKPSVVACWRTWQAYMAVYTSARLHLT